MAYGAEVYGLPPATVAALRRACQEVHGCAVQGRRSSLVLAVLDRDPGELQGAPVVRWAKEWWRASEASQVRTATLAMSELHGIFQEVAPRFDDTLPWHRLLGNSNLLHRASGCPTHRSSTELDRMHRSFVSLQS